ncbi:hypothetical protein PoB_004235300 [Plakobranchus ocellatus]|uniref:Uncharacterized protein n=1 Tax=Plakobranchus ocellatus TaxID=259542 RepID=A0AAV4B8C8_9GAST|nr:hypothetical protein PoB_004235300 [Plakobranchus ocellatus]
MDCLIQPVSFTRFLTRPIGEHQKSFSSACSGWCRGETKSIAGGKASGPPMFLALVNYTLEIKLTLSFHMTCRIGCLYIASPQQGGLRLSGPPPGQGAGGGARTPDRRVPADLRAKSLAILPPTPLCRDINDSTHSDLRVYINSR